MENYLKPKQYYIDLYDKHTVEICRMSEKPDDEADSKIPRSKKISKKEALRMTSVVRKLVLHFKVGERYLNKEKIISEWMEADRKKDELYESAEALEDIRCLTCRNRMKANYKELWSELDKEDRVLFMYDCPNGCLPRRAFFSDGEEWRVKPKLCLHCSTILNHKAKDDRIKLITTYICPKCKYVETDELVWTKKEDEKIDENFANDRERFCLTEEEGKKFRDESFQLEQLGKTLDRWKEEEKRRADKLKENPKGFSLEGVGYTCSICGASTPEGDNWYDKRGIKCLVCQKAIDDGEIPASLAKFKDTWYSKYDFESKFNVKSPTLRKWVRDGIVKARNISCYGKGVHFQLFLIKDNKDFLPPKKLVESRFVKERKDGKDWDCSHPWYHFGNPQELLKDYKIMNYLKIVKEGEEKKD